ncbi:family 43 glycosylhydrolase [Paenibacillus sp. Soil787]|uniref:glycoside hydrolase family 43 protein n=1 Tax=Paenibacillus sp. Soil787 TaxID=1736411 RepID=UPI0006FDEA00|nr:family 43 glycosylhydrolase [Paenibacillus sp. Soil787]KRF34560.1 alpha-N-arabinofuranosidase [Paenibacillus sp. Soil787]
MEKIALRNPLVLKRADPFIWKHTDGYYYFTATVPDYSYIELRRSETLEELSEAASKAVWHKHESGPLSSHIWAPEIHYVDGKWYIYFAAAWTSDTVEGLFDHRMYVLENESSNPLDGTWIEKGQIQTDWESFSLDATTFEHQGLRYLVWAQKDPRIQGNSNLYIAKMSNPWTLEGKQVCLTIPEYDWEVIGYMVNEGPAVLKRNGRIFITYSASATDFNYCMGMLTAKETDDLLDPASWVKEPVPVFQTNSEALRFGPGHNSFTTTSQGEDVLVYHARTYKEIDGDPLNDPNRHTCAQFFGWHIDGTPDFGKPS